MRGVGQPRIRAGGVDRMCEDMRTADSGGWRSGLWAWVACGAFACGAAIAQTGGPQDGRPAGAGNDAGSRFAGSSWSVTVGAAHRFAADVEGGGEVAVDRFYVGPQWRYGASRELGFGIGLGALQERYAFTGDEGFAALDPWRDVRTLSASGFVRWRFESDWTLFAIPVLGASAERGASLGDGVYGGGLAGVSYRFGERLTLGPGVGAFTEIEGEAIAFPILLVDWKIADRLSLRTGGGTAASRGPGLELEWQVSDRVTATVGGRWEQRRFRLDDEGIAAGGVGEDRSVPVFASIAHTWESGAKLTLLGGVELGGELRVDDANGNRITSADYDAAPFVGLAFEARF